MSLSLYQLHSISTTSGLRRNILDRSIGWSGNGPCTMLRYRNNKQRRELFDTILLYDTQTGRAHEKKYLERLVSSLSLREIYPCGSLSFLDNVTTKRTNTYLKTTLEERRWRFVLFMFSKRGTKAPLSPVACFSPGTSCMWRSPSNRCCCGSVGVVERRQFNLTSGLPDLYL